MNSTVTPYFENLTSWREELQLLRGQVLACSLTEELKWKQPCYTDHSGNIALIFQSKTYCGLSFFKGALLTDPVNALIRPTKNMQAVRQLRFNSVEEIKESEHLIKQYVNEAISIERSGKKVVMKTTDEFEKPTELIQLLEQDDQFKVAFEALTPGRQRGYLLHFAQPKQANTRSKRIQNCYNRILNGKGLRDCVCGRSKRMPTCDGSHKVKR